MEDVMSMFAGIDWGGAHHQLAIVDDVGDVKVNQRFAHTSDGVDELLAVLDALGTATPVAIERSEGILVEALQLAGHLVFPVSPRVSARARERYQAAARKDDRFDAFVLADTLRHEHGRWRPLAIPSPTLAELRVLVRDRRRILENQRGVESQLRSALEAYHPAAVKLFSSVDRSITLAFVRDYPTPEMATRVGSARMQRFLDRHGYTGRVPAEVLVDRLRTHLLTASAGSVEGHRFGALALVDQLDLLNRQLKAFDAHLADVFAAHPDSAIFASFPAAGPVIAASLLAEIGEDRDRLPTVEVLLAEAGLAPVTHSSGKVTRVRLRRACNLRLRDTFNWWAYTLKRIDEPSRVTYLAALDRGQHSHRALRTIGARWARILWGCWRDHTTYDPDRRTATL
jgi:transposase